MFNTNPWLSSASTSNCFKSSYMQGILDVSGTIVLRNGGFSLPNGDVSMNGNLWVGKNITFNGDISMNSNLYVRLDGSFNQNVSVNGATDMDYSIYQIDGKDNMNIASSVGTFPNYRTTATGPNLINIGSSNFDLVQNQLRDSIAIGSDIMEASNPIGHSNIGIGKRVFPLLLRGTQNIGIGNDIATSLIAGDNNIFIGNGVATNVVSGGNIIAIGANAGRNAGENCTFLGAFTGSLSTSYTNSTAIGYGTTITKSNQIKLGTVENFVCVPGSLRVDGLLSCTYFSPKKTFADARRTYTQPAIAADRVIQFPIDVGNPPRVGMQRFVNDNGVLDSNYFKAPVSGYYIFFVNIAFFRQGDFKYSLLSYGNDLSANSLLLSAFSVSNWGNGSTAGCYSNVVSSVCLLNAGDSVKILTVSTATLSLDNASDSRSTFSALLLAAV